MKCECITNIEQRLKECEGFKKPIEKVEMVDVSFTFEGDGIDTRTMTHIEITLEGQKKKHTTNMLHNFCPFCGKNQRPDKE